MKTTLILTFLGLMSFNSFAGSMNCRVTEMLDFGQWSGFPKSQVQLDSKIAEVVQSELGNNLKINLDKISASKEESLFIFKSATASEKLEIVIKPLADSSKFTMTLTQLSYRAAVLSQKSVEFSSKGSSVVRVAIDGNEKTMMAECDVSVN